MINKINNLYIKGFTQQEIIAILAKDKRKRERAPYLRSIKHQKVRSKQAVKALLDKPDEVIPVPTEDPTAPKHRELFKIYKNKVWKLTREQPVHLLNHSEKRAFKGYHLDHMISIWDGHKQGLLPEIIADISNLRFIPYKENMLKGIRSI
jgi:hypothetical protein